jgi:hypothetical protein
MREDGPIGKSGPDGANRPQRSIREEGVTAEGPGESSCVVWTVL